MNQPLTIAIPRGRILDEAIDLFSSAGIDLREVKKQQAERRLIVELPSANLKVLIVRDVDVPTFVSHGAADVGVAGLDVLAEIVGDVDLYWPVNLGIGKCRMVVAEPIDRPVDLNKMTHLRYATKFPVITRHHLCDRGITADIIKLYGSMEIAPLVGLADRIVDIVSTGETMRQHGLREVETIMPISARLCVNRASAHLRFKEVDDLVARLKAAVRRAQVMTEAVSVQ